MPEDFDDIPIRLPSGTKAIVRLPRPFTLADAMHILDFLQLYIEDEVKPKEGQKGESNA